MSFADSNTFPVYTFSVYKHLEKIRALQAGTLMEAMNMLAWDAPIWAFRPFLVGLGPSHE